MADEGETTSSTGWHEEVWLVASCLTLHVVDGLGKGDAHYLARASRTERHQIREVQLVAVIQRPGVVRRDAAVDTFVR